jgi:hypothetical protein
MFADDTTLYVTFDNHNSANALLKEQKIAGLHRQKK